MPHDGIGQELVEQDALVDLAAILVGLAQFGLGRDLGAGRHEARHHLGGVIGQPLDAHELCPRAGQSIVERAGMAAQEGETRVARGLLDRLGGLEGGGIALGLGGQAGEPLLGVEPIGREVRGIGREVAVCDRCRDHRIHVCFLPLGKLERATGFEPATYGLGSRRSTPELHPRRGILGQISVGRKQLSCRSADLQVRSVFIFRTARLLARS